MRWCLAESLRVTQTMTLMGTGLYNEPPERLAAVRPVLAAFSG